MEFVLGESVSVKMEVILGEMFFDESVVVVLVRQEVQVLGVVLHDGAVANPEWIRYVAGMRVVRQGYRTCRCPNREANEVGILDLGSRYPRGNLGKKRVREI